MRVLGLDLGGKRIGVAISDNDGKVATPLQVLTRSKNTLEDYKKINDLVSEWEVELVVVGMPFSLDGNKGPAAKAVEKEVEEIIEFERRKR